MYMNPQWSERSLTDEISDLMQRIKQLGQPSDRQGKHTVSYLKQMVKSKRDKLAILRNSNAN
jgi:hypothetical protein